MALNKSVLRKVFVVVLITWFVSLLVVYIPISNLVTQTFPITINNSTLTIFVVLSGLAFSMSFYLGLDILRAKP